MGSSSARPLQREMRDGLYGGTVFVGNADGNGARDFVRSVRIMEWNKMRIALILENP